MRSEVMEQGDPLYTANVQLLSDRDLSRMRMTKFSEIGASTIYGSLACGFKGFLWGERRGMEWKQMHIPINFFVHQGNVYVQDGGGLGFASYHFHPEAFGRLYDVLRFLPTGLISGC